MVMEQLGLRFLVLYRVGLWFFFFMLVYRCCGFQQGVEGVGRGFRGRVGRWQNSGCFGRFFSLFSWGVVYRDFVVGFLGFVRLWEVRLDRVISRYVRYSLFTSLVFGQCGQIKGFRGRLSEAFFFICIARRRGVGAFASFLGRVFGSLFLLGKERRVFLGSSRSVVVFVVFMGLGAFLGFVGVFFGVAVRFIRLLLV